MSDELTPKQELFCKEYLLDRNATQAAIRAGYSKKTAESQGSRLLSNVKIKTYVNKEIVRISDKFEVTQERILKEYARLAFHDMRKVFNEFGNIKRIIDLDDDTAAAIISVEQQETYDGFGSDRVQDGFVKKIKTADKKGALDSLARHLGMFTDKSEITFKVGLADRLNKAFSDAQKL